MTKGQALYTAMCASVGLDPQRHGVQAKVHKLCVDICTQPQLSTWKTGRLNPKPETVAAIESRFSFRLVQSWDWIPTEAT